MDSDKTFFKVIKFIVIIACIAGLIIRINISASLVNYYMAIVNTISFLVATNLWMYDCYAKLYNYYQKLEDEYIKKTRVWNIVMLSYILIYVFNLLMLITIYSLYFNLKIEISLLNDSFGILSLGLAISTDFLSVFITNIVLSLIDRT